MKYNGTPFEIDVGDWIAFVHGDRRDWGLGLIDRIEPRCEPNLVHVRWETPAGVLGPPCAVFITEIAKCSGYDLENARDIYNQAVAFDLKRRSQENRT